MYNLFKNKIAFQTKSSWAGIISVNSQFTPLFVKWEVCLMLMETFYDPLIMSGIGIQNLARNCGCYLRNYFLFCFIILTGTWLLQENVLFSEQKHKSIKARQNPCFSGTVSTLVAGAWPPAFLAKRSKWRSSGQPYGTSGFPRYPPPGLVFPEV